MKNLPAEVWGNGFGTTWELWFPKPRRFVLQTRDGDLLYVLKRGKGSDSVLNGGFWSYSKLGISKTCSCVACMSESIEEVKNFTDQCYRLFRDIDVNWVYSQLKKAKVV